MMTTKVTQQDNNKLKKQVQQIMEVNNEDYQEWLFQKHQEYLSENNDIITKALKLLSQSNSQDNTYEN
ncbi:hypothetical protein F1Z12_03425 [Staphylococcus aureus]|jgi:hypothetical protein|nr:hypothetical protein [Staphylococcus aureus]HCV2499308.1 hypothetical protein [Staphylococcus aureus]HCW9912958.1 hypothetical protein [Staphylococcus aureus]HCY0902244.1 hypothetical protein [Staphylococcus aureus]HDA9880390.1 hypothetical protein [Staphylococcus aureus]